MKRLFMIFCAVIGTFVLSLTASAFTYGGLGSTTNLSSQPDTEAEGEFLRTSTECRAYPLSWSGGSDYVIAPNAHYDYHYYVTINAYTRLVAGQTYEFSYLNHNMKIVTTPNTVYFYCDDIEKAHAGWAGSPNEDYYFLPWIRSVDGKYYVCFTVEIHDSFKLPYASLFRELHEMWTMPVDGSFTLGDTSIMYYEDGWDNTKLKFQGVEAPPPTPTVEAPNPTVEAPNPTVEAPSTTTVSPPYDGWEDDKNTVTSAFDFLKDAGNGLSSFFSAVFSFLPAPVLGLIAAAVVLLIVIGLVKALL